MKAVPFQQEGNFFQFRQMQICLSISLTHSFYSDNNSLMLYTGIMAYEKIFLRSPFQSWKCNWKYFNYRFNSGKDFEQNEEY